MQPGNYHTIYRRALIRASLIMLIFLLLTSVVIFTAQKNRIREVETSHLRSELIAGAAFIREALLKHDYQATEVFLNQWFEEHEDWLELEARMPNGFVITQRTRQDSKHGHGIELVYPAEFAGRKLAEIKVRYDVDAHFRQIKLLVTQITAGFILLVIMLFLSIRGVAKKHLIVPLEALHEESKQHENNIQKKSLELSERVRELKVLFSLAEIIAAPDLEEDEVIQRSVEIIPPALHYPEISCARITWHGQSFSTERFRETPWRLAAEIQLNGLSHGSIEAFYSEERPTQHEGPFLKEEITLLKHIAIRLGEALKHKSAQRELRNSEEKNRLLLESTTDGIYAIDRSGICTMCNPAAAHMLGYDEPSKLIGRNAHILFHHSHPDGSKYPQTECAMNSGFKEMLRVDNEVFWRADGTSFPVEYRTGPIYNEDRLIGAIVSFADLTERRNAELQLRQAQKLESIGQLAAGIAHEINTPTQFVNDNTRFLQEAFADYDRLLTAYERLTEAAANGNVPAELVTEVKALAQEIDVDYLKEEIPQAVEQSLEGLARTANIVRAMKEFSHPGTDEKTPTDLNRAIENTINVSRNEWKYCAELITKLDPELPLVPVLPGEFNQVILNMIVNSAQTIIDVVGTSGKMGEIRITSQRDGEWAKISISDTGKGIPQEIQKRIFDPFYTTKQVGKGTGQGLAIAWSVIVDKHGGSIDVESKENKGSSFTIRLPITQDTVS